jgi:tartrate dehydrogenase/decarboxylase/D-malate dehydrogenase
MMLDHLGETAAAGRIVQAIEHVVSAGDVRTPDLGGRSSTREVTAAVAAVLEPRTARV